jgi:hypothetical protein
MTDLKKAQHLILKSTPVLGKESVPVLDALKRVLVQDITAMEALPARTSFQVLHPTLTPFGSPENPGPAAPMTERSMKTRPSASRPGP